MTTKANEKDRKEHSEQLHGELADLRADFGKLRGDVANLVETLVEAGKETADDARKRMQNQAEHRLEQMRSGLKEMGRYGQDSLGSVEECVRQRPLSSIGIAVGVGYILGRLLRR